MIIHLTDLPEGKDQNQGEKNIDQNDACETPVPLLVNQEYWRTFFQIAQRRIMEEASKELFISHYMLLWASLRLT